MKIKRKVQLVKKEATPIAVGEKNVGAVTDGMRIFFFFHLSKIVCFSMYVCVCLVDF